jgi:hypothetical protein
MALVVALPVAVTGAGISTGAVALAGAGALAGPVARTISTRRSAAARTITVAGMP